jgi:hypothetical protein
MELVDLAVDRNVPGVGVACQRHLSSVAHAKLHGLTRVLTPLAGTPPEARQVYVRSSPTYRVTVWRCCEDKVVIRPVRR